MPENETWRGAPADWLNRARGDLALASVPLPKGGFYEDLCLHAQQAAEKAIKAIYVHLGWDFRYTHDLTALMRGLEKHGVTIPAEVFPAIDLTPYAYQTRYPERGVPIGPDQHGRALRLALATLTWAETVIGAKP